jgi:hypothetical protein
VIIGEAYESTAETNMAIGQEIAGTKLRSRVEVRRHSLLPAIEVSIQAVRSSMPLSINFVVANIAAVVQLMPFCQGLKRLVRIIWVYIGIIVRNDCALRAGKKPYLYLCVACV